MEEEEEAQLKRMESGSLLAICAMCFSMSFLVMIPSSLLKNKKQRQKSHTLLHLILCSLRHVRSQME